MTTVGRLFCAFIMSHSSPLPRWQRLARRVLNRTKVLDLCGITYRHPVRETEREFVCVEAPDWVNVVAITTTGQVVLVRQFRFGTNEFSLEVPGGVIEPGEDPVVAGVRELAEETGYGGGTASLLGSLHPNPAIQNNRFHAVLVEGVSPVQALDWDPDEEMEHTLAPVPEVLRGIAEGRITHSLTVCAMMLHQLRAAERRV